MEYRRITRITGPDCETVSSLVNTLPPPPPPNRVLHEALARSPPPDRGPICRQNHIALPRKGY